jgi:hypothetical protein
MMGAKAVSRVGAVTGIVDLGEAHRRLEQVRAARAEEASREPKAARGTRGTRGKRGKRDNPSRGSAKGEAKPKKRAK